MDISIEQKLQNQLQHSYTKERKTTPTPQARNINTTYAIRWLANEYGDRTKAT